jgi:hypothetical protein
MKPLAPILISLLALAACEGDSLTVPQSTFYDRTVISVDGQAYTVVTRPAEFGDREQYFVDVNGRYHECSAPTAEACAEPVRIALANVDH